MCGGDKRRRGNHGGGGCRHHFVDQRGLQGSFDAAAHQVTERNLEDVLTGCFTWWEKSQRVKKEEKESRK